MVFDKKSGLYERPLKVRQNNTPYALPVYSKESKAFSSQTASGAKIKLDWKEVSLSKNNCSSMLVSLSRKGNYFLCDFLWIYFKRS